MKRFSCVFYLIILSFFISKPLFASSIPTFTNSAMVVVEDNHGYSWKNYHGYIPSNAVVGGYEADRVLYICQAHYQGGLHPGKVVEGKCNITYGGHEVEQPIFRVLIGSGLRWVSVEPGEVFDNAIQGGYERGHPLYVCQARHAGGIHPGKIVAGLCNIGFGGNEFKKYNYRVLIKPNDWEIDDDQDSDIQTEVVEPDTWSNVETSYPIGNS